MSSPVLLLGNGINRLENDSGSWNELLNQIKNRVKLGELTKVDKDKPNTLLFEEIYSWFQRQEGGFREERFIKNSIIDELNSWRPNNIHRMIYDLEIEHIITTNYDYSIEKVTGEIFPDVSSFLETRYNLLRRRKAGGVNIWHAHGEIKET